MSLSSIAVTGAAFVLSITAAAAQAPSKIGLVQSITGAFNTVGKASVNGAHLYIQRHRDAVAGRKIQVVVKDDGTSPETAKRPAQELIVNKKVEVIGARITPTALTSAPLATEAKVPTVVMVSGASISVGRSPYMVRTSFTLGRSSSIMADCGRERREKVVTIVNEGVPGAFKDRLGKARAGRCRSTGDA